MIKREDKVILACVVLFNILSWFFFLFIFCGFPGVPVWPDDPAHALDGLKLGGYFSSHATLRSIVFGMKIAVLIVDFSELHTLLYHKSEPDGYQVLPISKKHVIVTTLSALVLYLPIWYYTSNLSDEYLWMLLAPELFLSIAFIVVVGIGLHNLHTQ